MNIKPIVSLHTGEWHRERFSEFAAAKTAVGEPTPHMRVLEHLCEDADDFEKMWRAGCYAAGYSLLTAEAIWREWPWPRILTDRPLFQAWLVDNWAGIHTRRPRRAVRTPDKFARCLIGYVDWALGYEGTAPLRAAPYEEWWDHANKVPFFGRYIVIRLLELYRRWGWMREPLPDVRAIGAHSPIRCLMLLYPQERAMLSVGTSAAVDPLAEMARVELTNVNQFAFAALLCEYRAAYEDRKDYAGNQTDEELEYLNSRYGQYWQARGHETAIWAARRAVSAPQYLGEMNGWQGRRLGPAAALRDHGIVWSDDRYNYGVSLAAGHPVLK